MTPSLIFFGSDQYSTIVLRQLLTTNYQILYVITDQKFDPSPVEKLAKKRNLKVLYYPDIPHSLITKDTLGLCASFDHLIPAKLITSFTGRLYNLHPSLLPQYRNVSPVQYAIALGDKETGITLFRISPGIDDGEIISQVSEPILPDDTTPTLTSRLFTLGAALFFEHLNTPGVKGTPHSGSVIPLGAPLIFTRRLTRDSGYLEWATLQKLLANQPISPSDTKNELLRLRLSRGSDLKGSAQPRPNNLRGRSDPINDLLRALTPWPGVWSTVPTRKGNLRIALTSPRHGGVIPDILIAGKPKAISWTDFQQYYL